MAEGITCYERDEILCDDSMCAHVGCLIRNRRMLYRPVPEDDLKNCHSYSVNRVVVTKNHVYGRFENGTWTVIKTPEAAKGR